MRKLFANISLITNFVSAALAVAVLFGWDITEDQVAGIMLAVNSFLALVAVYFHPGVPVGPGPTPPGP